MSVNKRGMEVRDRISGGVVVLDLLGTFTVGPDPLIDRVTELLEKGRRKFLLNLRRTRSLDSSGVGTLIRAYTRVTSHGGQIKLTSGLAVRAALEAHGLLTVFQTFDSEDEAVRSFEG